MQNALIGHTGFIGGRLARLQGASDRYNSRNISDIAGKEFDTVYCAGVPATMWLANQDPAADWTGIKALLDPLLSIKAGRMVVISTIAVFENGALQNDEDSTAFEQTLAYGKHRREFEEQILQAPNFDQKLVIRLPAVFAEGLKKNFIFDLQNPIASFYKPDAYRAAVDDLENALGDHAARSLETLYSWDEARGMHAVDRARLAEAPLPKGAVEHLIDRGHSALQFTNPESSFQFYNIDHLYEDCEKALNIGTDMLHASVQPVKAREVAQQCFGIKLPENDKAALIKQDMKSRFAQHWEGRDGYLYTKASVLSDLAKLA